MTLFVLRRLLLLAFCGILSIIATKIVIPSSRRIWRHRGSWQDPRCEAFPDPGNIAVAVHMSAAHVKLEQLNRVANIFHCLSSDKLIFLSDVDQSLGPYKLHNVVPETNTGGAFSWGGGFGFYKQQQKYAKRALQDASAPIVTRMSPDQLGGADGQAAPPGLQPGAPAPQAELPKKEMASQPASGATLLGEKVVVPQAAPASTPEMPQGQGKLAPHAPKLAAGMPQGNAGSPRAQALAEAELAKGNTAPLVAPVQPSPPAREKNAQKQAVPVQPGSPKGNAAPVQAVPVKPDMHNAKTAPLVALPVRPASPEEAAGAPLAIDGTSQDTQSAGQDTKSSIFKSAGVVVSSGPEEEDEATKQLHRMEKYRLLHMVERTWQLQPGLDWYVFPDVQGYYYWSNLVRWLREIDHREPRFLGKASRIASSKLDIPNDWAGFVLSGVAVKALIASKRLPEDVWEKKIEQMSSGHHVLALALHAELDLKMTDIWPLFIGEVLGRIPFKQEIWCEPVIGLSDVPSEVVLNLLQAEQVQLQNDPTAIFDYKELFNLMSVAYTTTTPHQFDNSETIFLYQRLWDNIADSTQYHEEHLNWTDPKLREDPTHFIHTLDDPNRTVASCAAACDAFKHCIQFSYMEYDARVIYSGRKLRNGGVCHLSKVYRYGRPREMRAWDDEGADEKFAAKSVGNTQAWSSAWNRRRWDDYTRGLVCH